MNELECLLLASILLSWLVASMVLRREEHWQWCNHPTTVPAMCAANAQWRLGKFSQVAALLRSCTTRTDSSPCVVIGAFFDVKSHHY